MNSVIVLHTDLFPDAATVEAATASAFGADARRFDLRRPDMEAADWDRITDALLAADCVITL